MHLLSGFKNMASIGYNTRYDNTVKTEATMWGIQEGIIEGETI